MHKLPLIQIAALTALVWLATLAPALHAEAATVMVATVDGPISPGSAEYIVGSIGRAEDANAEALVIQLDTPGGLDSSMRDIIKRILASRVPVVVYVSPSGARDASAGVFITMAAHIAAMAPQTNIGAAHPVSLGEKLDATMTEKVTNDAVAYIKSLAEQRGRNASWAEDAVRKSVSVTEQEALKLGVIDLVAPNLDALLVAIDGRTVKLATGERKLSTAHATVVRLDMGIRDRILRTITDPNVAYILMMLGIYGLFFELTNPGAVFPGVLGAICLILAFYSFQTLTVNYAGVLLIILAVVLFVFETQIVSHGVLAIGGTVALALGSLMLFENSGPFMRISYAVLIPALVITSAFFIVTVMLAVRSMRRHPVTGAESMVGREGRAASDITPEGGSAALHGEHWGAFSDEPIPKDSKIIVEAVVGLKLKVRKL